MAVGPLIQLTWISGKQSVKNQLLLDLVLKDLNVLSENVCTQGKSYFHIEWDLSYSFSKGFELFERFQKGTFSLHCAFFWLKILKKTERQDPKTIIIGF